MSPHRGSIHRQPRSDSGAVRLWQWARSRRAPWTCIDAAEAADISERRARTIITALHESGLVDCDRASELGHDGQQPATWMLSRAGRDLDDPPIMISNGRGIYIGARTADGDGNDTLRRILERADIATRDAARKLQINSRTLRRMLDGALKISTDDPIIGRARRL